MTTTRAVHVLMGCIGVLTAVALGCSDTELASSSPEIQVTWDEGYGYPDVLTFGMVTIGTYDEADVYVTNVGSGNLDISSIELALPTAELTEDGEATILEPEEAIVIHVRFTPLTNGPNTNILMIANGDTADPVEVPIETNADGDPIPDIYCEPPEHDFGEVETISAATQQFTVGNAGYNTLTVDHLEISGPGADAYAIIDDQVSGLSFEPNEPPSVLTVEFTPHDVAEYNAELNVYSNDPDENPLVVPLWGDGISPGGDGVIAVCAVNPSLVHPPFEMATFQGHDSYDTSGYDLVTYDWSLISVPSGSSASLPVCNNTPDCGPFTPDLGGTYTAQLYVENEIGQSDTCSVDLEAEPLEDLWIEMYWSHNDDDMDLHLLAPGGTPRTNTDCYYSNCVWSSPDWGSAGYAGDDPSLDLDDIPGTGPENINIPDPSSGTFTVFVDDYSGSTGDFSGGNDVTVNVYINGSLLWTDTRTMSGEGPDMYYCTVDWPSGNVTSL